MFVLKARDQQTQGRAQSQPCTQPSRWGPTHLCPGPLHTTPPAAASSAAASSPARPSHCSSMCPGCRAPAHTCLPAQLHPRENSLRRDKTERRVWSTAKVLHAAAESSRPLLKTSSLEQTAHRPTAEASRIEHSSLRTLDTTFLIFKAHLHTSTHIYS